MKKSNRWIISLAAALLLVSGCGGDGSKGEVSLDSLLVTVPGNVSPTAQVNRASINATQGQTVVLDGSASSDADGTIVRYEWQLRNGTVLGEGKVLHLGTASLSLGTYVIRLIVTDDAGATGVAESTLTVHARPQPRPEPRPTPTPTPDPSPSPSPSPTPTPTEDTTPPVITLSGSETVSVTQFAAYSDAGTTATDDVDGSVPVDTNGTVYTDTPGNYTITYSATDSAGNTATKTRTVTVTPFSITHNGTTYGAVKSPYTGKVWLDRNLGAARVCQSFDDVACYGDYYQWGRNFDGHQDSTSATTSTQATDVNNAGTDFITDDGTHDWDWAFAADNDGSLRQANWSKTDGSSVCPTGFRVPTIAELRAELLDEGSAQIQDRDDAFNSFLKLPSAGGRSLIDGAMEGMGAWDTVWSSSNNNGIYAYSLGFDSGSAEVIGAGIGLADGRTVRCIKN